VVRLIELNSFGAEMAATSALFHWVRDVEELYSAETICIRVRAAEEERTTLDNFHSRRRLPPQFCTEKAET